MRDRKRTIREAVLERRHALGEAERERLSAVLAQRLLGCTEISTASAVLAYVSVESEVGTRGLLSELLKLGKRLALPRVNRAQRRLDIYWVTDLTTDLESGTWNIPEPVAERCEQVMTRSEIDAVIAPGVAFTSQGARLGYGGGFYDRLLGDWPDKGCFIAPAFDEQLVEALPTESFDVRMHGVITPTRTFFAPSYTEQP
ncbi:MAG: 5-formyltetrahydrofolate cyclo-ligase [Betaproteobacteria bacterium]|nr:5-formyltetrahydrofolate cyclo-ligase [Betaproteobacteria bacterium]